METLEQLNSSGTIICKLPDSNEFGLFCNPIKIIKIINPDDILNAITQIEDAVDCGNYVAGFISYEASIAFDSAFHCKELNNFPYLYFGIYDSFTSLKKLPTEKYSLSKEFFRPEISEEEIVAIV